MTKKYMHTLDGKPAYFCPKEREIFFAAKGRFNAVRLVDSVVQIHRNEKVSARTRLDIFGETESKFEKGWVNVLVDEPQKSQRSRSSTVDISTSNSHREQ